jgi:protein-L-isoaspartate(D-aspartate) O-methyltransferase
MAWRSSSTSNSGLVNQLKQNQIIKSREVEHCMQLVDRGNYVANNAYLDTPQLIGEGQTISAPHMHAHSLETLKDVIMIPHANLLG